MVLNLKSSIATIAILALIGMGVGMSVGAADIIATVTPQNISVSLSATSVDYGVKNLSISDGSRTTALSDTFTVTNNGNVVEDFTITGDNSTILTLNFSPASTGTV